MTGAPANAGAHLSKMDPGLRRGDCNTKNAAGMIPASAGATAMRIGAGLRPGDCGSLLFSLALDST